MTSWSWACPTAAAIAQNTSRAHASRTAKGAPGSAHLALECPIGKRHDEERVLAVEVCAEDLDERRVRAIRSSTTVNTPERATGRPSFIAFQADELDVDGNAVITHLLVANVTLGPDARWSTLDGRRLYAHAETAGYLYEAALRATLARELGVLGSRRARSTRSSVALAMRWPSPTPICLTRCAAPMR
jgi:hypothetical protein